MPGKAWSSRWIDAQVLKHAARTTVAATVPMLKARAYHRTRSVKLARTFPRAQLPWNVAVVRS